MVKLWILSVLEFYINLSLPKLRLAMHSRNLLKRFITKLRLSNYLFAKSYPKIAEKYLQSLVDQGILASDAISFSQSGQDFFALDSLRKNRKNSGTYLELGSYLPYKNSNTALLEIHGWSGISIEKQPEIVNEFNSVRKNHAICADALSLNYGIICKSFNSHFDYCSIDIDPAHQSYLALKKILESGVTFNALTFEHDKYRDGLIIQLASVLLLKKFGMKRIEKNVQAPGFGAFEDWWINDI